MTNGEWLREQTDVIEGERAEEGWITVTINADWYDANRKERNQRVEGINIYCPHCGYKTTIIGTVNVPERSE